MIKVFVDKIFYSIVHNDIWILGCAIATLIVGIITIYYAKEIEKKIQEWKSNGKNTPFASNLWKKAGRRYSITLTLISLFPLFGMLGTVVALLTLNIGSGEFSGVSDNFFSALTSTAWGLIFSMLFKFALSFVQDYIEEQIKECKSLSDEAMITIAEEA